MLFETHQLPRQDELKGVKKKFPHAVSRVGKFLGAEICSPINSSLSILNFFTRDKFELTQLMHLAIFYVVVILNFESFMNAVELQKYAVI